MATARQGRGSPAFELVALLACAAPSRGQDGADHADCDKAAQLGFVKPHLGHLMAVLEIDQGRVGTLAAVGYEAEI